ncbi:hypothetical protein SEMRO_2087_G313900.1 [Seminavis robusta]|uniref:Uncharacterized protein n=1 Tax=Seminavis robusta TaxID=568900 RepID=A0A9N8EWW0_9STRA|nr:hypothetical protein SEMRO_2087_G313900.1 [Seminavis robusta]|eukprot:Sro2087_g313900.1 n/a (211) ;mRNA; r:16172-16804
MSNNNSKIQADQIIISVVDPRDGSTQLVTIQTLIPDQGPMQFEVVPISMVPSSRIGNSLPHLPRIPRIPDAIDSPTPGAGPVINLVDTSNDNDDESSTTELAEIKSEEEPSDDDEEEPSDDDAEEEPSDDEEKPSDDEEEAFAQAYAGLDLSQIDEDASTEGATNINNHAVARPVARPVPRRTRRNPRRTVRPIDEEEDFDHFPMSQDFF